MRRKRVTDKQNVRETCLKISPTYPQTKYFRTLAAGAKRNALKVMRSSTLLAEEGTGNVEFVKIVQMDLLESFVNVRRMDR